MITDQTARELIEAAKGYTACMGKPRQQDFIHPQAYADAVNVHERLMAALTRAQKEMGDE